MSRQNVEQNIRASAKTNVKNCAIAPEQSIKGNMTIACNYLNLTTPKMFTSYKLVQKARRGSNSKGTHKSFLQARQRSNALNANMYCMYVYTYIILCIYIHIIYIMHAYNICIQKIYIYKYYIYNLPRLHFKSQFVSSQVARCQIWHQ